MSHTWFTLNFPNFGNVDVHHTVLGVGSLGTVYFGRSRVDEVAYAIKLPNPQANWPTQILDEIFEREIGLHSSLPAHPNILPLLSSTKNTGDDGYALLLELDDGDTLGNLLTTYGNGGYGWQLAIEFGCQLCDAATHMHANQIAHLDINPGNILLNEQRNSIRLFDFNAAQALDGRAWDVDNLILANPLFAAPETRLCQGAAISDIYSIAASVFSIATNRAPTPFVSSDMLSEWRVWTTESAGGQSYEPKTETVQTPELALEIIRKAMDPEPDSRYQTAVELKSAMQSILD